MPFSGLRFRAILLCALIGLQGPVSAEGGKVIAGWVERVVLLPAGHDVKAKLDTGAKTSSLSARQIEQFRKDGKRWVRFTLSYEDSFNEQREQTLERPVVRRVRIKEHVGEYNSRPVVRLGLCFDGRRTEAEFSLVDRSNFIYPVLLGRSFLARHAVIDPGATFQLRKGCPDRAKVEEDA